MGKVSTIEAVFLNALMRTLSPLLEQCEREAVLGDLEEAQQGGWPAVMQIGGLVARRLGQRLRQGEALIPLRESQAIGDAAIAETWPEWVLPLAVGLVVAACTVALVLPKQGHTFTWSGLMSRSAFLLGVAAAAALVAVALLHRAYRDYFRKPGAMLLACAWSSAIWIPLLLLMWSEHALWMVLAPAPIAGVLASFAKRKQVAEAVRYETPLAVRKPLFATALEAGRAPVARLAIVVAILLEILAAAAAMRDFSLLCSAVIAITACMAWGLTSNTVAAGKESATPVKSRVAVLPCFLLTCLALTPFLRLGLGSSRLKSVVLANPFSSAPRVVPTPSTVYPGVVLMAPPLPRRKLLASPPRSAPGGVVRLAHPLVIPFDGAYWYFQAPSTGPAAGTKVERGDPLKEHVRSSDWEPIEMEAHQRLGQQLVASCCRSLAVSLVNADTRVGMIQVEARLRKVGEKATQSVSLGTVPIRSSLAKTISTVRPNVRETLHFPISGKAQAMEFNEITLVFHLAWGRQLAGARVQVSSFTLQP